MKNLSLKIVALFIISGLIFNGCETIQNANNTQKGTGIGAVAGAGLGALIGGKDNRALGAVIGAAVGGGAGAIIGNKMDKQAKEIEAAIPGAEVVRSEEGIQLILDENADVRFEYNSASLTSAASTNLDKLIDIFQTYPDTNILVVGHTDSKGGDDYNQTLSVKRAASVASYLESKGIAGSRLTSTGMGEAEPRATNETDAGRAQNRRVEFAITANDQMIEDAKEEAGE